MKKNADAGTSQEPGTGGISPDADAHI